MIREAGERESERVIKLIMSVCVQLVLTAS